MDQMELKFIRRDDGKCDVCWRRGEGPWMWHLSLSLHEAIDLGVAWLRDARGQG